jgi:hypothetical protein
MTNLRLKVKAMIFNVLYHKSFFGIACIHGIRINILSCYKLENTYAQKNKFFVHILRSKWSYIFFLFFYLRLERGRFFFTFFFLLVMLPLLRLSIRK